MRSFVLFLVMGVYWWLLSGQMKPLWIGSGIVCCLFTVFICRRLKILDDEMVPLGALVGLITYIPWLFWQIILSNIHVAKVVWSPVMPINPRVVKIPTKAKTGFGIMTYANSITLTPGTVVIEVDEEEMLVHALTDETADDLLSGEMGDKVCKMEGKTPS